jgi:molybdopterin-dependent oxidoreductase-like protein protein
VLAFCDGGYTTNLPLADLMGGRAWIAYEYDAEPLEPEHGGPARLLVPPPLLLKERQMGARNRAPRLRRARLLGGLRLPQPRRPLPAWPGHRVNVRLTAEDGYQASRSYSIASAPEHDRRRGLAPLMLLNRKCRAGEYWIQGGAG